MTTMPPDHYARYLEVLGAARSLYGGDVEAAQHWLSRPLTAFGGKAPGAMVTSRLETDVVIEFVRRLEHGFVA